MTEKAIVCVRAGEEYAVYLKDGDGGPVDLGTELIEALRKADAGQALQAVGAASLGQWVRHPEDALRDVRQDIEWIYVIRQCSATKTKSLEIHKTSYGHTRRRFTWPIWSGEVGVTDRVTAVQRMELVEICATVTLRALDAFERSAA